MMYMRLEILFAFLVSLHLSAASADCQNCTCCVDEQCHVNNTCINGCHAGFSGPGCDIKCSVDCLTCENQTNTNCVICNVGKYLNTLKRCADCPNECKQCTSETNCQECNYPYYNDDKTTDCSSLCPPNCLCELIGVCSSCKEGFYDLRNDCIGACPDTCKTCTDQTHCQSCKPSYHGYYGDICNLSCPTGCEHVEQGPQCVKDNGTCTRCKDGYEGPTCSDKTAASEECQNCTCCVDEQCYVNNTCINGCHAGFSGPECDIKCSVDCVTCENQTHTNCVTCDVGKYLDTLKRCADCPNECKQCTSETNCQECNYPYYNDDKTTDCSLYCPPNCLCEIIGICTSCKEGFYDLRNDCNGACPDTCKTCTDQTHCQSCKPSYSGDMCCIHDGHCLNCLSNEVCEGCEYGYYGDRCNLPCPTGCELVEQGPQCVKVNGTCTRCKDGYEGPTCSDKTASTECQNCTCCVDEQCDVNNTCMNGCHAGFSGPKCDIKCNEDCVTCENQTHTNCVTCDIGKYLNTQKRCAYCPNECKQCTSETNCQECNDPYFNDDKTTDCSLSCPPNCLCELIGICSSCKEGFYDLRNDCNGVCPDTCKTCTDQTHCQSCKPSYSGDMCCIQDGHCLNCPTNKVCEGCEYGYYGDRCNLPCPTGCKHVEQGPQCVQANGTCTGCKDGFHSDYCNTSCSEKCIKQDCNEGNGHCTEGCLDGYEGPTCSDRICHVRTTDIGKVIGIATAVCAAIIVVVILLAIITVRRWKMKLQRKYEVGPTTVARYVITDKRSASPDDVDISIINLQRDQSKYRRLDERNATNHNESMNKNIQLAPDS